MPEEKPEAPPKPVDIPSLLRQVLEGIGLDRVSIESSLNFYMALGRFADFTVRELPGPRIDVVVKSNEGKHYGFYVFPDRIEPIA